MPLVFEMIDVIKAAWEAQAIAKEVAGKSTLVLLRS